MIDIHAHILPSMDDGPSSLDQSLNMALKASDEGIHTIIATPHTLNGVYHNQREHILSECRKLNRALGEKNIPVKVLPGSEARLSMDITDELNDNQLMTMNDAGRYLLLELPDQFLPQAVTSFIRRLLNRGVTPVIAHPERNPSIQQKVELLYGLIQAGALSQLTSYSITGEFGSSALKCCKKLINQGMVHIIASDAHFPDKRFPMLSKAYAVISSMAGEDTTKKIKETPRMIISR